MTSRKSLSSSMILAMLLAVLSMVLDCDAESRMLFNASSATTSAGSFSMYSTARCRRPGRFRLMSIHDVMADATVGTACTIACRVIGSVVSLPCFAFRATRCL